MRRVTRRRSTCPGYAIGGVSVGEGHELLCKASPITRGTAACPKTSPAI